MDKQMTGDGAARTGRFIGGQHYENVEPGKHTDMMAMLEAFLHAYYDLLDETGGPPSKYRAAINEGLDAVEHLWWASLDDDG